MRASLPAILAIAAATTGCPPVDNPDDDNEGEVITSIRLTFTPAAGAAVVATHADPENDGDAIVDDITLANGTEYTLTLEFLNELEDPAEDITAEVADEAAEHQVIIYGSGVSGPATGDSGTARVEHEYADEDENGLPIGLENTITGITTGTGEFKVMLRHMPPENDAAVKNETVAEDFASDGSAGIGGDIDIDVTFALTVE